MRNECFLLQTVVVQWLVAGFCFCKGVWLGETHSMIDW